MNRLIEDAKKTNFMLPAIGTFAFAFLLYTVGMFIGGNAAFTLVQKSAVLNDYYTYLELFSNIVVFVVFFAWVKIAERRKIRHLGLYKENALKDTGKGFFIGIAAFMLVIAILAALGVLEFGGFSINSKSVIGVIAIIPLWFIQAGSEEVFSRGFVLPLVSAKTNKTMGIILSSIVFTLIHLGNRGLTPLAVVNITLVGVFLALYTLYKENIWGAIGFHTAWNYVQGCILGLSVSGNVPIDPRLMTMATKGKGILAGGSFGVEGSIVTSIVLLSLIGMATGLLIKKKHGNV